MQQMDTFTPRHTGITGWISGNIRRKLLLFVVVILLIVVGLFWFFSATMLQPAYQNSLRSELAAVLDTVVNILDAEAAEGRPVLVYTRDAATGQMKPRLSDTAIQQVSDALESGALNLNGRCLEIADQNGRYAFGVDHLSPRCLLHPSHELGLSADGIFYVTPELNGEFAGLLRQATFEQGEIFREDTENGVITAGRIAADGTVSVIVTFNMERVGQAASVLKRLLLPLSLLIFLFGSCASWIFSRWFTRPLSRLSDAAREMAKGNYDVRVDIEADDEIGELAHDFNQMAYEVGRSAQLQRDILANVSHDLRTPLTLIKGYAETVRDLTGDNPEKRTEQLNVIVDESDRLSALVGSVMELSRISSGTERPEAVDFDLNDLCDELAYRYEEICRQMGNTFFFSGEEGCTLHADPNLLERALHNLLGNAISHVGEDGFIGLKVCRTGYGTVRCEVTDHGLGIDEADLPHIFDKYYRSRADTGKPGTGLGLSITKTIFTLQNIDYGVITEKGKGSTFWFEAPYMPPPVVG